MIVLVDAGNTRLKWGALAALPSASGQRSSFAPSLAPSFDSVGALSRESIGEFPDAMRRLAPRRMVASNVAGAAVRAAIEAAAAGAGATLQWVNSEAQRCGVRNGYADPTRLGTDRWVALIGARHRFPAAVLVVNCGTATTCDLLQADGVFVGGAILPGLELMKRALAGNTAQLPLEDGRHENTPKRTVDAIETGCLEAQAGAIERMHARLDPSAPCVMSGGAAERIAPLLTRFAVQIVPHLTLEGIAAVAADTPMEETR